MKGKNGVKIAWYKMTHTLFAKWAIENNSDALAATQIK